MNISSNLSASVAANSFKSGQKAPGKPALPAGGESSGEFSDDPAETAVFAGRASQQTSDSNSTFPAISSVSDAESQVVFLKNVILALPALVLRAQANPAQDFGLKLL